MLILVRILETLVTVLVVGLTGGQAHGQGVTDLGLGPFYAQTAWPSVHRDSRNSDFSPFVAPLVNRVKWTALDGAAVLLAPVAGPEGDLYVTTGRGPGTSHLHAFDRDGNLTWESVPQTDLDDLDSSAVFSAPVVDKEGVVYIGDRNQFWAFRSDGTVKWVVEIPDSGRPFASAIITNEGYVGGITLDGKVVLYNRDDGLLAVPVFDLPGGAGPPGSPVLPGLWLGGLLDPEIIEDTLHLGLGEVFEVTNTPALSPETGRIYITAAGATPDAGVLYGLDVVSDQVEIAFQTPMGGRSGTSPAISHDGLKVYAVDGTGLMTAFDADTGLPLWTAAGTKPTWSPAIGPDETIYTGRSSLTALDPTDGSVRWSQNYNALADAVLPSLPPSPPVFLTGQPVARTNGVISTSATKVWAVLVLGYEYREPVSEATLVQPRVSVLVSVNPSNGSLTGITPLRDSSDGLISVNSNGSLYISHAGAWSSVFFYGLNQILPPELQMPGPPLAGLSAIGPLSFRQLAVDGIQWVKALNTQALTELAGGDVDSAFTAVRRGHYQVAATLGTVGDAVAEGEIDAGTAQTVGQHLGEARWHVLVARLFLGLPSPNGLQQLLAAAQISQAETELDMALSIMGTRVWQERPGELPRASAKERR